MPCRLMLIALVHLGLSYCVHSQPKNKRKIGRTCDFYEFNVSKLSFELEGAPLFYLEQLRSVTGLEGSKVKFGNCEDSLQITFEKGDRESIESFLKKKFPRRPKHYPLTVDFRFELLEQVPGHEHWLLQADFYRTVDDQLAKVFYKDVILDVFVPTYLEPIVSKLIGETFQGLLRQNPGGVALPFYENDPALYVNFTSPNLDSIEIFRSWKQFESGEPFMNYPSKLRAMGSTLPWYELDSCALADFLPSTDILAFVLGNDRFLNVGENRFMKLNPLGNGHYLGRAATHLSSEQAHFYGLIFEPGNLTDEEAISYQKVNVLVKANGDIEIVNLRMLAEMFSSDEVTRRKLYDLHRAGELDLETKEAFVIEALRRDGKIP